MFVPNTLGTFSQSSEPWNLLPRWGIAELVYKMGSSLFFHLALQLLVTVVLLLVVVEQMEEWSETADETELAGLPVELVEALC